jgi:putative transposase
VLARPYLLSDRETRTDGFIAPQMSAELDQTIKERRKPKTIVSDNGTELTSKAILRWADASGLRDEFLNENLFTSLAQARVMLTQWRRDYNGRRPHSRLGWQTPLEFALAFNPRRTTPLRPHHKLK